MNASRSPRKAGLLLGMLQAALLLGLVLQVQIERRRSPRAWVRVMAVDPERPIRGRYVDLQLVLPDPDGTAPVPADDPLTAGRQGRWVHLEVKGDRIVARPGSTRESLQQRAHWAKPVRIEGQPMLRLSGEPVAFFLPPDQPDPTLRPKGESLWLEASVIDQAMPRPLRLGVMRQGTGVGSEAAIRPLSWP